MCALMLTHTHTRTHVHSWIIVCALHKLMGFCSCRRWQRNRTRFGCGSPHPPPPPDTFIRGMARHSAQVGNQHTHTHTYPSKSALQRQHTTRRQPTHALFTVPAEVTEKYMNPLVRGSFSLRIAEICWCCDNTRARMQKSRRYDDAVDWWCCLCVRRFGNTT